MAGGHTSWYDYARFVIEVARQSGMDDFLPKPIQRKQFLEILARIRPQA